MNILEQTEALKDMPDAVLIQQMKMPTGQIAPIFITSELKRRKRMRDEYARREAADTPTVAEEVVMAAGMPSGGIADAARALAPKTDMGQNTGMAEMAPRAATRAPQPMASGGIVGMRQGGKLVKVGRANFYAFPDGEVFVENPDGSREAVTDPRVLGVVRAQANVGPERQESAAPLGSEILQEAAPQRPTLESTLSSDRPFNPQQMEVTDTRPAVPSSLGMGGERPSTLTDVTQPTALSEMEKARLATEFTQQQELARAIRDQQEQGIASLNPPSADLGQYENRDAIESFNKRTFGKPMTPADKAEERLLFNNMNIPPDSPFAEFAGVDNPETQLRGYRGGKDYMDESEDFYDDISKNLLPPKTPDQIAREDLEKQKGLDAFLKSQEMRGGRPGGSLPVDVLSQPVTDDTYRMPDAPSNAKRDFDVMVPTIDRDSSIDQQLLSKALEAKSLPITPTEDFRREFADYGDDISPFDPSDIKSNAQRAVSDLGLTPITRDGEEYFISPAGMVFKQEGDNIVPVAGGEAMQAMDVAQRQGEDFSVSPSKLLGIFGQAGTYAVDPETGVVDPSKFTPFSGGDISGAKTPQFLADALGPGSTVSSLLNVQEGAAPVTKVDETGVSVAPASPAEDVVGFGAQPGYDDYPMPAPITLSEKEAVGIEAARPKARPQGVAPVAGDTTTPTTPDGGITTVSTKAINDAAKQSKGLSTDAWLAIAQGGAAIAASKNPTLLGALGEGAGVAASSLMAQRASDKAASLKQDQIDATLEAARIRAAAAGKRGMAPPTGSSVLTYLSGQLDQAKLDLQTLESAKSRTKKTSEWKLDKVRTEQEIERLQRDINTLLYGGSVASAGGTGSQAKNIDVSKG